MQSLNNVGNHLVSHIDPHGNEAGGDLNTKPQESRNYGPPKRLKNPRKAILLAAVPGLFGIAGLGHIYADRVQRGIAVMIVYFIAVFYMLVSFIFMNPQAGAFGLVVMFVVWAAQVKGAYDLTIEYNLSLTNDSM